LRGAGSGAADIAPRTACARAARSGQPPRWRVEAAALAFASQRTRELALQYRRQLSTIKAFLNRSGGVADAREPVMAWFRQVRQADWTKPADVKRDIRSASVLKDGRVVFNIAGNKYRIVVWINDPYRVVYIPFIGTHRQYDAIDAQSI
jgi:mRNA interferase HigB